MRDLLAASRPIRYAIIGALFISLVGAMTEARAEDGILTWQHPTTYTNGDPIPAGGLSATELQYGKCNATRTGLLATPAPATVSVPHPATTRTITGLTNGEWCFAARSTQPIGEPSAWTGYAWKLVALVPNPPVLSATITLAYDTWTFGGKVYLGRNVGTLPIGTPCIEGAVVTTATRNYYEIPASAVTLTRTPNKGKLVTQCAAA